MSPEELLKLDALSALYMLAKDHIQINRLKVKAEWYRPLGPVAVSDVVTDVTFVLDKTRTPVANWNAIQSFRIRYDRLDISAVVPEGTAIEGDLPISYPKLIGGYLKRWGIPVSDNEFEEGYLSEEGPVTLRADAGGYRWVGSTTINFTKLVRDLNEFIKINNVVTDVSTTFASTNVGNDIVKHLNASNKFRGLEPLTAEHVQICTPIAVETATDKFNTKVKVMARGGLYSGEGYVYYKRKTFPETWRRPIEISWTGSTSAFDYLEAISEKIGCIVTTTDFVSDVIITPPRLRSSTEMLLTFKESSLGYVGELKVRLND